MTNRACCLFFSGLIVILGALNVNVCGAEDDSSRSAHHATSGFRNPHLLEPARAGVFGYVRMRYFSDVKFASYDDQAHRVPQVSVDLDRIRRPQPDQAQVTWIGHATSLIQYRDVNILTDPIFSTRASPLTFLGPSRHTPPAISIHDLPAIDFVVISHNHYDHLDRPTVNALANDTTWLVPLRVGEWLIAQGVDATRVVELDWWDHQRFGPVEFVATPAQHFSGRTLWDKYRTLWSSWVIRIHDLDAWFSGDTGYNPIQFKQIGDRFGGFDLALIPIGAYEPRWFMKPMHINPSEAVKIHQDLRSRYSIGVHWGTFQLSAEAIDAPMQSLARAVTEAGMDARAFDTMAIGETRTVQLDTAKSTQSGVSELKPTPAYW